MYYDLVEIVSLLNEPITEIVWVNKNNHEVSVDVSSAYNDTYLTINDADGNAASLHIEYIPKLEAALAKARELGWFE